MQRLILTGADYIFGSFGIIKFIFNYLKIRVLRKPVLGGMASTSVAQFIYSLPVMNRLNGTKFEVSFL